MKQYLNIEQWERKDQFFFFKQFDEPFFGITVEVDVTKAYATAKAQGISFFLYYLYQSLKAANAVDNFKYRIDGDQVIVYDQVHASPTINRPDGTFGFSYIDYHPDFPTFLEAASKEVARVQASTGLVPANSNENVIHYSSIPWINFTSLSHARSFAFKESIPKISFGKMTELGNKRIMPMSVHAHHALMDGYHVSRYIDIFQENLNA